MFTVETKNVPGSMRKVLRDFAENIGMNIYAKGSDEFESALYPPNTKKDRLEIYFYAAPAVGAYSGGKEKSYYRAFGYDLDNDQSTGVTPSLIGFQIEDGEDNLVAEVVENTIYVLFDLLDFDGWLGVEEANSILQKILESYAKAPSLTKRRELEGKKKMDLRSKSFPNFRRLLADSGHSSAEIKRQYDVITRISKGDLIVYDGGIRIPLGKKQTRSSFDRSGQVDIGEVFFILLPEKWDDGDFVEIYYLDPRRKGKHPHIYSDGNSCIGNIHYGVSEFLHDKEIALAAEAIKLFVEES